MDGSTVPAHWVIFPVDDCLSSRPIGDILWFSSGLGSLTIVVDPSERTFPNWEFWGRHTYL